MNGRCALAAGLLLSLQAPNLCAAGVDMAALGFMDNAAEAMTLAADQNRPVFVDFSTTWCVWCRRLEADVFSTADFQEGTRNWVKLSLDAEKEGEGVEWAKRFHVSGYPTTVLLNPDGSEIDRMSGYAPMPTFLQVFQDYAEGKGTLATLQAELERSPGDLELRFRVLEKLEGRGADTWQEQARAVLAADPENTAGFGARSAGMLAMGEYRADKNPAGRNPALLETFVNRFGATEPGLDARNALVSHYRRTDDRENATRHLAAVLAEHPENPQALNGFAWTCTELDWNLEAAREAALKADRLQPGQTGIIDTIAEVEFRLGHKEAALEQIGRALALSPEDSYLKEQQAKFRGQ